MNKKTETVILESLRMLLWENHRKWESINLKHGGGECVETKEIGELISRINDILNPKQKSIILEKTNDTFSESSEVKNE